MSYPYTTTWEPNKAVPPAHEANCDLCGTLIHGNRYKCLTCPDFDSCTNCFSIIGVRHPGHDFARLRQPEDLIKLDNSHQAPHSATCDICTRPILGIRFKCMHPDCPDFDLCALCEARPKSAHPITHPLLKIKIPNIPIPEVCRHGFLPQPAMDGFGQSLGM